MLVILGVISILPMIYMGKIEPKAFIESILNADFKLSGLDVKVPEKLSNMTNDNKIQVYKWRDQNGVMQFSNEPPPATIDAEQIELNPNSNVVQAIKIPEKKSIEKVKNVAKTDMPNPYSVKGMKKVMDDAKNVEHILQQRHEDQQKMLNDL